MSRGGHLALAAIAAVLCGLTIAVAQPPLSAWPATFLSAPLLLCAVAAEVDARPHARAGAFRWGLLAGVVAYGPMLAWLIAPAGVLAWVLLVLIQAGFLGLFAVAVAPAVTSAWVVAAAPVLWAGMDALRAVVPLGGFEWGSLAYAHVAGSWMLPVARLVGGRGITVLTVLVGALLFEAGRRVRLATKAGPDGPAGGLTDRLRDGLPHAQPAFVGMTAALLVSVLATIEPPAETGETLDVLAVQGNDIEGWFQGSGDDEDLAIADRMLALTEQAVAEGGRPALTVWPESSVDRDPFVASGEDLRPTVQAAAAATDGNLVVGVNLAGSGPRTFQNTVVELTADAEPAQRYVKRHLVPFGEYVPFRSLIGDFPPLRQVPRDGIPGEHPDSLTVAGTTVAVVICFETLFPDLLRENIIAGEDDAQLVLATTNDASFGRSAEPAQHLAQSRLRAVETGRWVVHASLSGSSAFVSPDGAVHDATELFTLDTIRREVPLVSGRTPFLSIGDVLGDLLRWLTLGWLVVLVTRHVVGRRRPTGAPEPVPATPEEGP